MSNQLEVKGSNMKNKNEISTNVENSPAQLIIEAVKGGADLDKLKGLMELQERWDANQARKAFHKAMAAFKVNPPKIDKDKTVNYQSSKGVVKYDHASLGHVCEKINKALSEHGLSASWTTKQNGKVIVTCKITHELGHSEETSLEANADDSGSKNSIQAIGSTITYLQRYTLLALTGLATDDQDDDGTKSMPAEAKKVSPLDFVNNLGIKKLGSTDAFMAWRVDNEIPEDLTKASKEQLQTIIKKLNGIKA